MITEDYVSFETAKLLKEKGFESDECIAIYDLGDNNAFIRDSGIFENGPEDYLEFQWGEEWKRFGYYLAPTIQMAMKWLREKHNQNVTVKAYNNVARLKTIYYAEVQNLSEPSEKGFCVNACIFKDTYEEACESAIRYTLENLI